MYAVFSIKIQYSPEFNMLLPVQIFAQCIEIYVIVRKYFSLKSELHVLCITLSCITATISYLFLISWSMIPRIHA